MMQRFKSFFATVDRDYHINAVKGLTDALGRAEKRIAELRADLATASAREEVHSGVRSEAHRLKCEVERLRKALAESEATSEQRRVALEHEHAARKESDRNALCHGQENARLREGRIKLEAHACELEDALTKSNLSLGLSRDRREAIGKQLDDLREAADEAVGFFYRNSSVGSMAHEIGCKLAGRLNN